MANTTLLSHDILIRYHEIQYNSTLFGKVSPLPDILEINSDSFIVAETEPIEFNEKTVKDFVSICFEYRICGQPRLYQGRTVVLMTEDLHDEGWFNMREKVRCIVPFAYHDSAFNDEINITKLQNRAIVKPIILPIGELINETDFSKIYKNSDEVNKYILPEGLNLLDPPNYLNIYLARLKCGLYTKIKFHQIEYDFHFKALRIPCTPLLPILVYPWIEGVTLYNLPYDKLKLHFSELLKSGLQEIDKLKSLNIYHRDLHSSNIIVDEVNRTLKFIDFDEARVDKSESIDHSVDTRHGCPKKYEVWWQLPTKERNVDYTYEEEGKMDSYSFVISMYNLITQSKVLEIRTTFDFLTGEIIEEITNFKFYIKVSDISDEDNDLMSKILFG